MTSYMVSDVFWIMNGREYLSLLSQGKTAGLMIPFSSRLRAFSVMRRMRNIFETGRTQAFDLDCRMLHFEPGIAGRDHKRVQNTFVSQFSDHAAVTADQELCRVNAVRFMIMFCVLMQNMCAGDKGGQAFHLVDQTLLKQKIECSIDGGRGRVAVKILELIQQFISPGRAFAVDQNAQNLPTDRRQTDTVFAAEQFCAFQKSLGR